MISVLAFALIAIQVIVGAVLFRIARRGQTSPILMVSLVLAYLLWYVVPVATMLVAPERILPQMFQFITLETFAKYALIETAAFLLMLVLFMAGPSCIRAITEGQLASFDLKPWQYGVVVVVAVAALVAVRLETLAITGATYEKINAFNVVAEGTGAARIVTILAFAESVLLAFLSAWVITPRRQAKLITAMAWIGIVAASLSLVLVGGRIALLTPIALLLMAVHERRLAGKRLLAVYGGLGVVLATVGVLATLVIANLRVYGAIHLNELRNQSEKIVVQRSRLAGRLWDTFDQVNTKFDSIVAGAVLVERFGAGVAGSKPYAGAALAVVPRRLLPSKPVPGSIDGTNRGIPSRMVAVVMGYDPDTGNVGVSPAAIAVWQFGIIGVAVLAVLNAVKLVLIQSLLVPRSILTRTLAMFLIAVPTFFGIFSQGDALIMNVERAMVIYAAATATLFAASLWRARVGRSGSTP